MSVIFNVNNIILIQHVNASNAINDIAMGVLQSGYSNCSVIFVSFEIQYGARVDKEKNPKKI